MKAVRIFFFALVFVGVASLNVDAQCAMCKAVLESGNDATGTVPPSGGINDGIVYLMMFPYLLIAGFLLFNYRSELRQMISDAF